MPKSLSPVGSQTYELQLQTKKIYKPKLKSTVKMMEEALIELHNIKGVTLKHIHKYILEKYNLDSISKVRATLIKKYLKSLLETKDIVNKSGKGLVGHFKLVNKKNFSRKISINHKKTHKKKTKLIISNSVRNRSKQRDRLTAKGKKTTRNLDDPKINRKQLSPVPLNPNSVSVFDTPMMPTQVHTSTALITTRIPGAPELRKKGNKTHKRIISDDEADDSGTPRSSLPKKRRKLLNRPEN